MLTELPPQFAGPNLLTLINMLERTPGLTTRELAQRCHVSNELMADVLEFLEQEQVTKAITRKVRR